MSLLSLIAVSRDRPIFELDLTTGPLAERLAENVPVGPFPRPLFIGIGTSDEVVSPSIQDSYVDSLCASGQPLEYRTYSDKTHMGVLRDEDSALPADLEQWTKDRLNGLPAENTCPARTGRWQPSALEDEGTAMPGRLLQRVDEVLAHGHRQHDGRRGALRRGVGDCRDLPRL